ncbi:MAG: helix-turn-helix transcriptional regulator, partial [Mesorhizobium sp.]
LPYVATRFHMFVRRKLSADRIVDGVRLTAREYECAQWAACGKTAWEIGCILGITRRTAAFHLDNAEANCKRSAALPIAAAGRSP